MTLRIGLVGHGYAGRTIHAPLIAGVPGLALAAVASRDADAVRAAWPSARPLPTPDALIADPGIDVVVLATPNRTHHPLARAALEAGKHVVVDKPFTLTLAEALDLEALASARGRVLSVFHNRRWDGDFLTVADLLARGTLGRVVHLESRIDRYRPQVRERWRESAEPGAGIWFDLGPHLLDQAVRLLGWPTAITLDLATVREGGLSTDLFLARLHHGDARATLQASMLAAANGPRLAVHGTRGSFVKHGFDRQEDALKAGARPGWPPPADWGRDDGRAELTLGDAPAQPCTLQPGRWGDYYAALRDAIVDGAANPVPAREACGVMALIEHGLASAATGRTVATPPL